MAILSFIFGRVTMKGEVEDYFNYLQEKKEARGRQSSDLK